MDETTDGSAVAPTAAHEGVADRWYPALPEWKLYLLTVLTLGTALLFWTYRTARDIRDHHAPTVKAWAYPLSFVIGLITAAAGARQAQHLREMAGPERVVSACNPTLIFVLIFGLMLAIALSSRFDWASVLLIAMLALPAPWLFMQRQSNRIKADLGENVEWVSPPGRYTSGQWVAMITGGLVWVVIIVGAASEFYRPEGLDVFRGQAVEGTDGNFKVTIPAPGWQRVPAGTIGDADSSLELFGRDTETWAVAYVQEDGTLNDVVAARRELIANDLTDLTISEDRVLLDGTLHPVSHARYTGQDLLGFRQHWWVTTVEADDRTIELIAATEDRMTPHDEMRALAESLALTDGANPWAGRPATP